MIDFRPLHNRRIVGQRIRLTHEREKIYKGISLARLRGSLLALFGPPAEESSDADCAYDYFLEASINKKTLWELHVYEGPSGFVIANKNPGHPESLLIAEKLIELLEQTQPSDFETELDALDYQCTIRYGCKDGNCYYEEIPIDS